jgi:hypothetical protein
MDYELGLRALKLRLPAEALDEFNTLEARLLENLHQERLFGGTETTRASRAQIIFGLSQLAQRLLGISFNDLCQLPAEAPSAVMAKSGGPSAVPPSAPVGPIRNRWALLVGVNNYIDPSYPPLQYCVNDVQALDALLAPLGYTVVTLHDQATEPRLQPTCTNVEAELSRLCNVAGLDDLLLVYFTCHGKLRDGRSVLVLRDTRDATLSKSGLAVAEIEDYLRKSKARRAVLMLDACHSGVQVKADLADPEFIKNVYDTARGYAVIAASMAQQVAHESAEKKQGIFTHYVLDGLAGSADRSGKRFVTVNDLSNHVLDALNRWSIQHGGQLQEPTLLAEGRGDMILADYRNPNIQVRIENNPLSQSV